MATFIDKGDKERAKFETKVAQRTIIDRQERERKSKLDNAKRRFATLRLKVERAKDAKNVLESEIQTLEQKIKGLEKETSFKSRSSVSSSPARSFETEAKLRNTGTKQEIAKKKVDHNARMFAEAVTKMKTIERELTEARAELSRLESESRRLQDERAKGTKEKREREDAITETKNEVSRAITALRAKKNLLPAAQREYKKMADEMENLQTEIRSLER